MTTVLPTCVPGRGKLRFERAAGRTVVAQALSHSPLRVLTPRRHGEAAWAYCASFGGGLVDGDEIELAIAVEPGAAALLTTQASTKVYRSPAGASQRLSATVGEGGALALVPDPLVCFAGARYRQRIEVALGARASLVLVDALSAGRSGYGERWAFDRYESRIRISQAGEVVLRDALVLDPAHGSVAERMGRFEILATVILLGPLFQGGAAALVADVAGLPVAGPSLETASALGDGVLYRIGSGDLETATQSLRARIRFALEPFGGDPAAHKL